MFNEVKCYSPIGAAKEIALRSHTWAVDERESVGLLVVRFASSTLIDQRVNPVLVVRCGKRTWIYARNTSSRLVNDTYAALVSEGVTVCGMWKVTHLDSVDVDWYA